MDSVFMTLSFVGSNALARELGPDADGVFVTQVVPSPKDDALPVVAAYPPRPLRLRPRRRPRLCLL